MYNIYIVYILYMYNIYIVYIFSQGLYYIL